jgi:hypothetical protein
MFAIFEYAKFVVFAGIAKVATVPVAVLAANW